MSLVHYVVIRRDMNFGEYSAQLDHGGEAYILAVTPKISGHDHPPPFDFNTTTSIIKGARNEARLIKLEAALIAAKVPHIAIREELGEKGGRLAGQLTCISLMPAEKENVEPFVREFHTIEGLDPVVGAPLRLPLAAHASGGTPRRARIDLATPAEKAIRAVLAAVEAVGADVLLTEAVVLLDQARNKVADYLEQAPRP